MKIQTKFFLLSMVAVLAVVGQAFEEEQFANQSERQTSLLFDIANITQRHMESDMMHDAMRGDVLAAIVAGQKGDAGGVQQANTDLSEHYENFKTNLADNQKENNLPDTVKGSFDGLLADLEGYREAAEKVIAAQQYGQSTDESLKDFNTRFSIMEEGMESISDQINQWAVQTREAAKATEKAARTMVLALTALAIIASLMVPLFSWRGLFRPLRGIINTMHQVSSNHLDVTIPGIGRVDEVGEIAAAVSIFKENAVEKQRLEDERHQIEARSQEEKRQAREELARRFETRVQGIIQTVTASAAQLYKTSEGMGFIIANTSNKATNVAQASGQTSQDVHNVAAAAEEMSATVKEIAQQIVRSADMVKVAVSEVNRADDTSAQLDAATQKIGQIVGMIQDIAGQINLLALNATIESARAGEAGRGFAVVAGEVKALANQTSKATDDIVSHIQSIQTVSQHVIQALKSIKQAISSVDEYSSAISSAVEEQSATTNEIASSMNNAAEGTNRINSDIEVVNQSSQDASSAATEVLDAAKLLSSESEKLSKEVSGFLMEIRHG